MSNAYCTFTQFQTFYDIRSLQMLGNDANQRLETQTLIQSLLDASASYIDQFLNGRFNIDPTNVPAVLTAYVAERTVAMLYRRRGDVPKGVAAALEQQDKMLQQIAEGSLSLAGLAPATLPALVASDSLTGRSRFDHIRDFDYPASPTSPGGDRSNLR
jgi:phage gp36-like protein